MRNETDCMSTNNWWIRCTSGRMRGVGGKPRGGDWWRMQAGTGSRACMLCCGFVAWPMPHGRRKAGGSSVANGHVCSLSTKPQQSWHIRLLLPASFPATKPPQTGPSRAACLLLNSTAGLVSLAQRIDQLSVKIRHPSATVNQTVGRAQTKSC